MTKIFLITTQATFKWNKNMFQMVESSKNKNLNKFMV